MSHLFILEGCGYGREYHNLLGDGLQVPGEKIRCEGFEKRSDWAAEAAARSLCVAIRRSEGEKAVAQRRD